jgi:hypothetical protein
MAISHSREKDSGQSAVGSKCETTDYRTTETQKILNRRFTPIIADHFFHRLLKTRCIPVAVVPQPNRVNRESRVGPEIVVDDGSAARGVWLPSSATATRRR